MSDQQLEDLDPMPFGAHKGKPMQDVPVRYLHWLWNNASGGQPLVRDYIRRNLSALQKEDEDLIWE